MFDIKLSQWQKLIISYFTVTKELYLCIYNDSKLSNYANYNNSFVMRFLKNGCTRAKVNEISFPQNGSSANFQLHFSKKLQCV